MRVISIIIVFLYIVQNVNGQSIDNKKKVIQITSDSCRIWNLPVVDFQVEVPYELAIEYNSSGGFYFQARELDSNKNIKVEISISRVEGSIDEIEYMNVLAEANESLRNALKKIEVDYWLLSINKELIGKTEYSVLKIKTKATIPGLFDGNYYGVIVPIKLKAGLVMLSSVISADYKLDERNGIPILINQVIESIK
jgi:hypothetical protein